MRTLLACTFLAAFAPVAWGGDSLRCGDRIVSTEDLAAEVLAACGEPDYRDYWLLPPAYVAAEETWWYNFGSQRFVQILRFRNGELVSIQSDGYGFDTPAASSCAPTEIVTGLSAFRLIHRCGRPSTRESFDELRPMHREGTVAAYDTVKPVRRERWVYDFGPDRRMRVVTLRNGRVSDVDSGERGSE